MNSETAAQEPGKRVSQRACAKINLTLDVLDERPDGYHEISTILESIRLWDDVILETAPDGGTRMECNVPFLKADMKNLAYRAAVRMRELFSIPGGLRITLTKRIPIAAGLAGGSADAAAVLKGVNRLYRLRLSQEQLMRIGEELGSDVPYCIMRGTCLATGRGERVQRLAKPMPPASVVLVKPAFGISTAWSYAHFDPSKVERRPDEEKMKEAIEAGDLDGVGGQMVNLLETAAIQEYPVIQTIKDDLGSFGASGVMMSGSGPAVFALFKKRKDARKACAFCRNKYPYPHQVLMSELDTARPPSQPANQ